jgi:N-acetylmuramoyl-L-alanine amidase
MAIKQKHINRFMRVSNIHIKIFSLIILTLFLAFALLPLGLSAQNKEVVAKNGDGIYKILKRNNLNPDIYTNAFIELNKTRLGENNQLFIGVKYRLPNVESKSKKANLEEDKNSLEVIEESSLSGENEQPPKKESVATPAKNQIKTLNYSIFGKKYSNVSVKSNELKGAVYYLKSGHGGPDPGAMGTYQGHTVCEDEYAYDVTLRMARNLVERGATVYMIVIDKNDGIRDDAFLMPDKDEVCYPNKTIPLNQIKRLQQRVDIINDLYNKHGNAFQRFIAIHVDSRSRGENIDIFFYHDTKSNKGKQAATILQQTFRDKYREVQPGRGYSGSVSARNLYVLKNSYPVGVYIELANMNHQRDIKRLIIPDNRQAVANWLTQGLITDYKSNK